MGVLVCDGERKRDRDRQREVLVSRSLSIIVN